MRTQCGNVLKSTDSHAAAVQDILLNQVTGFCNRPDQYVWIYVGRRDVLVPFDYGPAYSGAGQEPVVPAFPSGDRLRVEMRHLWVVEGRLRRGESNVLTRRRFYLEDGSWRILLGEGYDITEALVKCYLLHMYGAGEISDRGCWYSMVGPGSGDLF
jgi:hypothetical protein